jgi:hypothetical protein
MAFYPPGMTLEGTARVARMAATDYNEHGATVCRPATITTNDPRDARLFMCFVAAGLVPPASLFFLSVVASFGLHVAHLTPNAMITLAIFQHLCEGFVGIRASVALFRHYFRPQLNEGRVAGAVSWNHRGLHPFISLGLRNKWDEWRPHWCFVRFLEPNDSFDPPTAAPVPSAEWELLDERDSELAPAFARIEDLHNRGLNGRHVALDFIRSAIAPLQERSHPMWEYEGPSDRTRLRGAYSREEEEALTATFLKALFGGEPTLTFPDSVLPLWRDPPRRDALVASMPDCDELGVKASVPRPGCRGSPSSRSAGGAAGGSAPARDEGAERPSRRRIRLRTLAEAEEEGVFRTPPPPSPPMSPPPLHPQSGGDDDDDDNVPIASRIRRTPAS